MYILVVVVVVVTVAVERVEKPDRSYKPGRQLIYNRKYQSELFAGPSIYSDRPELRINKKTRVTKKEKKRLQAEGEKKSWRLDELLVCV